MKNLILFCLMCLFFAIICAQEGGDQGGGVPEGGDQGEGVPEGGDQGEGVPEGGNQGGEVPEGGDQGEEVPEIKKRGNKREKKRLDLSRIKSSYAGVNLGEILLLSRSNPAARDPRTNKIIVACRHTYEKYKPQGGQISSCQYKKCVNGKITIETCPQGKGVTEQFKRLGYSKKFPCNKIKQECKSSLAEKGVQNVDLRVCGIDLVLIVDMSCSIALEDKLKVKRSMLKVMQMLPIYKPFTQVGIVAYAKRVEYKKLFSTPGASAYTKSQSQRQAYEAVKKIPTVMTCGTATYDALKEAREVIFASSNGNRISVENPNKWRDVAIVLSDGMTNPFDQQNQTITEAKKLRDLGVDVYLVKLPNLRDKQGSEEVQKNRKAHAEREFKEIPSTQGNRFDLDSFDELNGIVQKILKKSCIVV